MSKRLLFSDIHLHTWAYGSTVTENGFNSRLLAQKRVLQAMIEDAHQQDVKYAYFLGDLFHVHGMIPTQALVVAADMFSLMRNLGIKIRAIAGNHDMATREGGYNALSWLPEEERTGLWDDDGLLIQALPYRENRDQIEAFLAEAKNNGAGMVMMHQGVQGVPLSSGYVLDEVLTPDMIPAGIRAFTGHYHFHRAVTPNLTVVGNLTPLTWGDLDQEKGWVIWDDKTGALEQRIQKQSPNFVTFYEGNAPEVAMGNFVRYMTPVKPKQIDSIREKLIKFGARTVEFPEVITDKKKDKIRTGDDITIEHIVNQFANSDMAPRRREVGLEVRKEKYGQA